jgi:ABC-type Fe3+-hydroxamate transport system substrate-binding protein
MISHTVRSQRRNTVIDALGRIVPTGIEARRVVSLVPSETESVAVLAGLDRLVGRTSYCIEPVGQIETVPVVGGTKNVDLDAVRALAPDLVLANQEEGSRRDVERLIASGLRVHVSFPRTLAQSVDYLASLSALLGLDPESDVVRAARDELATARARIPTRVTRVWVPIWDDPWMSFDGRTFASDVLAHAGLENVMAERARRYPLAADLGDAPTARVDPERDTRYPRMRLEEAMARRPDVVLLPDEPFRFTEVHAEEIRRAGTARVVFVDGKDLFWYGVRAARSPERLRGITCSPRLASGAT